MFLGIPFSRFGLLIFTRLWLNAGVRLAYPFLPTIARGLGITIEQAGLFVAARSFVGLFGIAFGFLSEKKGEKAGLLLGLAFFSLSGLCIGFHLNRTWVFIGFTLMGLAHAVYNPAVQAYVSGQTPYRIRARALGLLESSWSAGWFVGIPLGGFLISRYGWYIPYMLLGFMGLILFLATLRVPSTSKKFPDLSEPPARGENPPDGTFTMDGQRRKCARVRTAPAGSPGRHSKPWPALGVSFFALLGNESLMIVYGAWMESRFSIGTGSLGILSTFIGLMELAAELSVVLMVDRLGKKRALSFGLVGAALCYAALPAAQTSVALSVVVFGAIAYFFEFTVVSAFPYVSELNPNARGRWLSANYSFMVAGRVVGALFGPWLWEHTHTLRAHMALSLLATAVAAVFLAMAPNPDRSRKRPDHGWIP